VAPNMAGHVSKVEKSIHDVVQIYFCTLLKPHLTLQEIGRMYNMTYDIEVAVKDICKINLESRKCESLYTNIAYLFCKEHKMLFLLPLCTTQQAINH